MSAQQVTNPEDIMAAKFARTRKAPSRSGTLHYAFCPKCDAEYGGWRGLTQDFDAAQAQADEHNTQEHGGQS